MNPVAFLIVFLGSGLGGILRHGINQLFPTSDTAMPYGLIVINITGSILLGLLAGYFSFKGEASQHWRLFLATGICGGYTTFSGFSQETVLIAERGQLSLAGLYVIVSVTLSVAGFMAGLWAMRQLGRRGAAHQTWQSENAYAINTPFTNSREGVP